MGRTLQLKSGKAENQEQMWKDNFGKNVLNVFLQEEKGGKSIIRNRSVEEGEETEGVCAR